MEVKLRNPIKKDDREINSINLNLEQLKGNDIIRIENEARLRGSTSPEPLLSSEGLAITAARVSGLLPDDIMEFSAPDFIEVTSLVKSFLYGWVLPEKMQSEVYEKQS